MRDVSLVSYLPPFLAEYAEVRAALEAIDPEFALLWQAAKRLCDNAFIVSADEYGLSRFEAMLGLFSSPEDTLESRRNRVLAQWFNTIPYTIRRLSDILKIFCGEGNFAVMQEGYTLTVKIGLAAKNRFRDVGGLLEQVVPRNMVIDLQQLYNTHGDLASFTHRDLSGYTHPDVRGENLVPGADPVTHGARRGLTHGELAAMSHRMIHNGKELAHA